MDRMVFNEYAPCLLPTPTVQEIAARRGKVKMSGYDSIGLGDGDGLLNPMLKTKHQTVVGLVTCVWTGSKWKMSGAR
ncbi:unnamed protein product [Linum trigynum]|uniref:Uncharacterized protein n=1 Tax=Linum trigynum TaxID=586398 RepID=A0AAV2DTG2_9ROSI